jgi:hypothetical protein
MAYLINDELIWISTPKCASYAVETSLINSKLKLQKFISTSRPNHHIHIPLKECLTKFGKKESICITRDWFSKWISSLNYIWDYIEFDTELRPICKWEDVDNKFLYNLFDTEFLNDLHFTNNAVNLKCFLKLLNIENTNITSIPPEISNIMMTLVSEKFYKSNQKCTYEFDIKEIDKFINFIEEKFGEKLIIDGSNISTKRTNNIIINDELKQFVWDSFEKRFEKRSELI